MASERKFVAENVRRVLLKEYLMKEVSRAGFGGLEVQRTPMGTRVALQTERPGLVIGRKGQTIKINAQIMAEKLAFSLERGWHFRRAGHATLRRVMDAGARGCYIILAGKLSGQRHRTEKFKEGSIKYCGDPKIQFVKHGFAVATLKMGVIGVTVEIMEGDSKLPAEIKVVGKDVAAEKFPDLFKVEAASQVKEE